MKPLFLSVIFCLFASCSTAPRTTTSNVVEDTQVENPPFEIIDLTITPWVAGRKESGKGYMLKLILAQPFATLDSVLYVMPRVFGKPRIHLPKRQFILPTSAKKISIKMN